MVQHVHFARFGCQSSLRPWSVKLAGWLTYDDWLTQATWSAGRVQPLVDVVVLTGLYGKQRIFPSQAQKTKRPSAKYCRSSRSFSLPLQAWIPESCTDRGLSVCGFVGLWVCDGLWISGWSKSRNLLEAWPTQLFSLPSSQCCFCLKRLPASQLSGFWHESWKHAKKIEEIWKHTKLNSETRRQAKYAERWVAKIVGETCKVNPWGIQHYKIDQRMSMWYVILYFSVDILFACWDLFALSHYSIHVL